MSSHWIEMKWKNKDRVFVNKAAWHSASTRVDFKYNLQQSKVYAGSRTNFSPLNPPIGKKKTVKYNNYSQNNKNNKAQSSMYSNNTKINDFLMIATNANQKMAANLLRNSNWNVRKALEFYFKHETQIHSNSSSSYQSNSKKRKHCDSKEDDIISPPMKRAKLAKSLNEMTVPELKKEIKKRDKKQKITNFKKSELKSILFQQIRLSPSEINKLNRKEIINELKLCDKYTGKSSWNRSDLTDYLKFLNSNPNAMDNNTLNDIDDPKEISKNEFIKMPLYKIQKVYRFESKQTNRNEMYNQLQNRWKYEKAQQINDADECVICFEEKPEYLCTPCGHLCLCSQCKDAVTECPICRAKDVMIIKLYT